MAATEADEETLDKRVKKWLNETGFPLEMRTTAKFSRHPDLAAQWVVRSNTTYTDAETQELREVDVSAWTIIDNLTGPIQEHSRRELAIGLGVVVECKTSSKPWVVLVPSFEGGEPSVWNSLHRWRMTSSIGRSKKNSNIVRNGFNTFTNELQDSLWGNAGYGLVEALKPAGSNNPARDAAMQVLDAAKAVKDDDIAADADVDAVGFNYIFPVIVKTGKVYEATLDEESAEVVTRTVEMSAVKVESAKSGCAIVVIVSEQGLSALIEMFAEMARAARDFLLKFDETRLE